MLVLSRQPSEKIVIPDLGITLKVISIRGNTVKLGFDAPSDVAIFRGELVEPTLDASCCQKGTASAQTSHSDQDSNQDYTTQPKSNGRSRRRVYGEIGRTQGLQKYLQSDQTDDRYSTSKTAVEGSEIDVALDVAIEDAPNQVGEEQALYRISF